MSWTAIDANTSWQSLAIAQEIATAYNKRVAVYNAFYPAAIQPIAPNGDMTVHDFIHTVQLGLILMSSRWSDPSVTLSPTLAGVPWGYPTEADFFTAAGLGYSGYFRRIPHDQSAPADWTIYADAGWNYGLISDKDLAGPWLFKDLETALDHMTRFSTASFGSGLLASASASGTLAPPAIPAISGSAPNYATANTTFGLKLNAHRGVEDNTLAESGESAYIADFPLTGATSEPKDIHTYLMTDMGFDGADYFDWGTGFVQNKYNMMWYWTNTTDSDFHPGFAALETWSELTSQLTDWTTLINAAPSGDTKSLSVLNTLWWIIDYRFDP